MKVVIVVQARTGSTRLPGKVLRPAAGATLLQRMLERVCSAEQADEVVVATTTDPADDAIADVARIVDVPVVRGHATDLLDRHRTAAQERAADVVVKVPSDCPLIDPDTIDRVIGTFRARAAMGAIDYVSNLHPPSWPDGFDVEVIARDTLEIAWCEALHPLEREHTTPYIWRDPSRFTLANVRWDQPFDASSLYRLTLDYEEDYAVLRTVYDTLWTEHRHFSLDDVLALLASRPGLAGTNRMHIGSGWIQRHRQELTHLPGALHE